MGTAFSASMYGLSGALVLGFLDLTAGQAQNRFFNELEEWLAGLTRLSFRCAGGRRRLGAGLCAGAAGADGGEPGGRCSASWCAARKAARRRNQAVMTLTERIGDADRHDAHQPAAHAAHRRDAGGAGPGAAAACRRCTAATTWRGRTCATSSCTCNGCWPRPSRAARSSLAELRNDLRVLTRTVAALAEEREISASVAHAYAAPRRQRAGRLARLRGRAVHAAHGHHLRAAGVRAGPGVPVGGAVRPRQGSWTR